ncbi:MAG: glutamate-5-semialdehyde dehydrogenase [Eubacteriaceae bacterium]|nr:glutamate-5-semialdehyde dehydrogenase [Eubacteriaceae bacterium]
MKELSGIAKRESYVLAALSGEKRKFALENIAQEIKRNAEEIFAANDEDLKRAEEAGLPMPVIKRLAFKEEKLAETLNEISALINLPDPVGEVTLHRELAEGLILKRVTCPIGVIGAIFESRPDALVQIACLCIKSGNCVILKGGSEAASTNKALFKAIHTAALAAGLPENCLILAESREDVKSLLSCAGNVDLLLPRGSNEFVRYIMENTTIPVIGHSEGLCSIYIDEEYDPEIALRVVLDAKTQYVAVCNALDTLLIHKNAAPAIFPKIAEMFKEAKVELRAQEALLKYADCVKAREEDFDTEFLDYILAVKQVESLEEAIEHINSHSSHHTDGIITKNPENAEKFMNEVDSAGVYLNCSTRFADGNRYGFGAEVGISTGKIHARGPVGLSGLVTYKYKLYGNGDTVGQFAVGEKKYTHKDLD